MSECKPSWTLTVHLRIEATVINNTNDIVIAMFELDTLLIVLQMCGRNMLPSDFIDFSSFINVFIILLALCFSRLLSVSLVAL